VLAKRAPPNEGPMQFRPSQPKSRSGGWGCPAPCVLCKGRADGSRCRRLASHLEQIDIIHTNQSHLSPPIVPKTAPSPLLRLQYQAALDWVAMHVAQLFHSLLLRPHIEIIKPRLPDWLRFRRPALRIAFRPALPSHYSLRIPLFHTLHHARRITHLRLAHQQMKVLGHHHITKHHEPLLLSDLFENLQEQITALLVAEPRLSPVATAGDVVQISRTVITPQAAGHSPILGVNLGRRL
jgi:hypothetical protein